MIITFYSNFLNHHQLPFCEAMYKRLGDNYKFVATTPTNKERLNMGYYDMNKQYPFVLTTYDSEDNKKEAMRLALESDIIITGSAPEIYTSERMKLNKITFRYSERPLKKGRWRVLRPRNLIYMLKNHTRYRNKNLYMLCASAYTAGDFALVGAYKNKTYKWGYFPEVKRYNMQELMSLKKHDIIEILWAGRFLGLKHPEKAIYVAKQLKNDGYHFKMNIVGSGEKENYLKNLVNECNLNDCITFLGTMPPEKVREYMERSNIFLFTSDYNEGWGAVLNESMNSGCAVVASHAIGSVPFLLKHMENGLIYHNNNINDLYNCVQQLINEAELRDRSGKNAYMTLRDTWNADIAADRLIDLFENLLVGKKTSIKNGPCSIAEATPQRKMYSLIVNNQ